MEKQPFFNIIIPTRERSQTLFWTLKTCLEQDYSNYKIIVSDNCSQDNTFEVVSSFNSTKILYCKTPNRLSMSHNWEFALNHVKDGYVIFLGDDDGLVKNSLSILARIIKKTQSKAYRLSNITYYWENNLSDNPYLSNMCYNIFLRDEYKYIKSECIIENLTNTLDYYGENGFLILPSLYHGCIHVSIINEIKNDNNGIFFNSNCPDMFSALAIAAKLPKFIHYYAPVCINGLSKFSNGLSSYNVYKRENKEKLEFDKFIEEKPIPFSSLLINDLQITKHFLIPRPLLVADQFYKLKELNPSCRVPSIENVISVCIDYVFKNSQSLEQLNSYLEIIRHTAAINKREDFLNNILKNKKVEIVDNLPKTNDVVFHYDVMSRAAIVNTSKFGIKNVYDLSIFLYELFKESQRAFFYRPKLATSSKNQISKYKYFFYYYLKKYLPDYIYDILRQLYQHSFIGKYFRHI